MVMDRRRALALLGSVFVGGIPGPAFANRRGGRGVYLSANAVSDGHYRVAGITPDGGKSFERELPGRAHGFAMHPHRRQAVIFARRPGTYAIVFDPADGTARTRLDSPAGRHFYGHGAFSADGRRLFTTENDYDGETGVIGVWETGNGYRRVAEWPSHGIGPHELVLSPDGTTLIVANGGILTHPDTGRHALNIPTMAPSLVYLDARDGRLRGKYGFDAARHRFLSIRHLAVNAGNTVCIGLQDHGPGGAPVPLVAFHATGEPRLDLRAVPRELRRRLHGYMGAVAMSTDGHYAAVSAPRGNAVTLWDVRRRAFVAAVDLRDGCGVAPAADGKGGFLATSGAGGALRADPGTGGSAPVDTPFLAARHWDNHLMAMALDG